MNAYPLTPALWLNSAAAGLLVLLVLLVQWLFRRHLNPQWRCALWLVVVARLLLPVSIGSPVSLMRWLPQPPEPVSYVSIPEQTIPAFKWFKAGSVNPGSPDLPSVTAVEAPRLQQNYIGDAVPLLREDPARVQIGVVLFWTWLAGIVVLGANVLRVTTRLNRRFSRLPACSDPAVLALLQECANRMDLPRIPPVVESPDVTSPALHGFLRPRLLLPAGFARDFSPAEMRLVFLHELAHLKRRDLPLNWIVTGLQIVHWFNPLLWLGFARWRSDREIACDALALEAAGADQNQNYGRTILHLLERNGPRFAGSGMVGILEDRQQLRRRLEMISSFVPGRRRSLLALALVGVLAAVGLTDAQPPVPVIPQSAMPALAVTNSAPAASVSPAVYTGGETLQVTRNANGASDQRLRAVHLNPDGTLDPAFNPAQGDLAVKVGDPLARNFETPDTKSGRWSFVRLKPDGTVDTTFNSGPALTLKGPLAGTALAAEVQPDGKVLVGGSFQSANRPGETTTEIPENLADQVASSLARNVVAWIDADGKLVTLSIVFHNEDIRSVVRNIADLFQLNLVIPESLQGKTSVMLRDATWRQIFKSVLEPFRYTFVENGNVIKIVKAVPVPSYRFNEGTGGIEVTGFTFRPASDFTTPGGDRLTAPQLVTEVIPIKSAAIADLRLKLAGMIQELQDAGQKATTQDGVTAREHLSNAVTFTVDLRGSAVIISGYETDLRLIRPLIAKLDVPPPPVPASAPAQPQSRIDPKAPWRALAAKDFVNFYLSQIPPDDSVIAPLAAEGEIPEANVAEQLRMIGSILPTWEPGKAADPVQRVRNLLYVAGGADLRQLPVERYLPATIMARLQQEVPDRTELTQILCWIAQHPAAGEDSAIDQLSELLGNGGGLSSPDKREIRNRAYYYAVKLMNRAVAMR